MSMISAHYGQGMLALCLGLALTFTWSMRVEADSDTYRVGKAHWLDQEYRPAYDNLMVFRCEPYGR
jgi:hypothetical protein